MTTYTATFRTADTWAAHEIDAATPEQALQQAHTLAAAKKSTLDWCTYDPASIDIEEIEITGPDDTGACWQSDDLALRLAADDLLAALEQAVEALNTVPRFRVPHLDTDSYAIASLCDRTIAKAKGGAA